jgi:hypothetical protein
MKKKRLFVDNGHPHGTVLLNWHGTPEQEFTHFAEAFHLVAKDAVMVLREDPKFGLEGWPANHFRAYPVVFLYRHALELYMKAVILVGSPMLVIKGTAVIDRNTLLTTHSLDKLRLHLEQVFEAYGWEWDLGTPNFTSIKDFRNIVAELQAVDAGSYAFRYPLDTKGNASLKAQLRFNLFDFCEVLDSLFPALEGAAIGAHEELQVAWAERDQWE